jgi:hypothetical protein
MMRIVHQDRKGQVMEGEVLSVSVGRQLIINLALECRIVVVSALMARA